MDGCQQKKLAHTYGNTVFPAYSDTLGTWEKYQLVSPN